ncbi:MAG: alkylmercury lyase family protein, partial [Candidatus Coatesbacteria bacterium]
MKPELTEVVKEVIEEARAVEDMEAKFGRSLSADEDDVRRFILTRTAVWGRIPLVAEIKEAFARLPGEEVDAVLRALDEVDVIHLAEDGVSVAAAYPFSGPETPHLVTPYAGDYRPVYAMCAVDALGIPFMLGCDVAIHSRCGHCDDAVDLRVEGGEITSLEPASAVVWFDLEPHPCAAASCCPNTNFFASAEHHAAGQEGRPPRR